MCALHHQLNKAHKDLKFTVEVEENDSINFLDVKLQRREDGTLSRGLHRKPTWTGQHPHFKSFAPIKQKRALVRTLFNRLHRIVTDDRVEQEEIALKKTLIENGYPARFLDKYSKPKQSQEVALTVPRKSVYLSLPFKGDDVSALIKRRLTAVLRRTCNAAQLLFVEKTFLVLTPPRKDLVSLLAKSNLIHQFDCICGARYIGRTKRHLGTRIGEHIPKWIRNSTSGCPKSAIAKHLLESGHVVDPIKCFTVIFTSKHTHTSDCGSCSYSPF
jgi:hypothetical protein